MKKILKTVPCILVAAFTLAGACACNNSVSDIRSRERQLRERMRGEQQQRLTEQEEQNLEEIDPNFTVDPKCPHCPDCPDIPEEPEEGTHTEDSGDEDTTNPVPPEHGRNPHRRWHGKKPKPTPYPLPHN